MSRRFYVLCLLATTFSTVAGCVIFGEWLWAKNNLMAKVSPFYYQIALAVDRGRTVTTIAVGDSHTGTGFRSRAEGKLSVGFAGESTKESLVKTKYLLSKLPNVLEIYLQADPHMFFRHRLRPIGQAYLDLGKSSYYHPLEGMMMQFDPCCRGGVLREMLRFIMGRTGEFKGPDVGRNGYLDYTPYQDFDPLKFDELAKREIESYQSLVPVGELMGAYEEIIKYSREKNIRVILTHYPLSPEYLRELPLSVLEEMNRYFSRLAAKHGAAQCGSWTAMSEGFMNPDHLSPEGADRYWHTLDAC